MSHISKTVFLASNGIPDRDSCSGLTELCQRFPAIAVVVLSGQREAMVGALQVMFSGSAVVPAESRAHDALAPPPDQKQPAISRPQVSASDLGLRARQLDVLALMMQGKSNKAICRVLNLAEPTVKNHVTAILRGLRASNRTEAVIAVGKLGWKLPTPAQFDLRSRISVSSNSNIAAPAVS